MTIDQGLVTRRALMKGAIVLGAAGLAPAMPGEARASNVSDKERGRMMSLAEGFMKRHKVPGMSVCIAHNGHIQFSEGLGLASREDNQPVTPDSLFRIASLSKPITSVAIYTLVEKGLLKTSDRVFGRDSLFGSHYALKPDDTLTPEITVDHLLTHTVGAWTNDNRDPMFIDPAWTADMVIRSILYHEPPTAKPGRKYAYSNFGYCILGRVIEKVTGKSYEAYVREAVLQPSGATGLRIGANTAAERAPGEVRYYPTDDWDPYSINVTRMDSHGGWIATAPDLVRFMLSYDRFKSVPDLLTAESTKAMTTPTKANQHYARGWGVNRGNWFHSGELPGTTTIMVRAANGLCWAALANTRKANSSLGADMDDLIWKMTQQPRAWR